VRLWKVNCLLSHSLFSLSHSKNTITESIILAGGFGTRLQTVVSDLPKPMASVADKPFLHYVVKQLIQQGIQRIVFSVGYKSEYIIDYFSNTDFGIEMLFQKESEPLGTGGGIKYAMLACQSNDILVLNGDTYFDIDFSTLHTIYLEKKAKAALALRFVDNAGRYGQVKLDENNTIVAFEEKNLTEVKAGCINGGTYILNKNYFIENTEKKFSIEKDFFEKQVEQSVLAGHVYDNYFIDIGIPEDYYKANEDFRTF
jgi:D-glycero-alpha-D-manno-heptose 1-phosphate guanylyltransferase